MKRTTIVVYLLTIVAALSVGGIVLQILVAFGEKPPEKKPEPEPPVLHVVAARSVAMRDVVTGFGTAQAKTRAELVPQVTGIILSVADRYQVGGAFLEGEVLAKIDTADYEMAVAQAAAATRQAEALLAQAEAGVASASVGINLARARAIQAEAAKEQAKFQVDDAASGVERALQEVIRTTTLVTQAKARLDSEEALAQLARLEWEDFARREREAGRDPGQPADLVLRISQIADALAAVDAAEAGVASARAAVASAESGLERARSLFSSAGQGLVVASEEILAAQASERSAIEAKGAAQAALDGAIEAAKQADMNLERTSIKAPFDGRFDAIHANRGTRVGPNMAIAVLVASDAVDVPVPIAVDQLAFLSFAEEGTTLRVSYHYAGQEHTLHHAVIAGTEAAINADDRTLKVIVRVAKPFELAAPLLPGTFVRAEFEAVQEVVRGRLPRKVLRATAPKALQERFPATRHWVVVVKPDQAPNNTTYRYATLEFRPVELVRTQGQDAIIGAFRPDLLQDGRLSNTNDGELVLATTLVPVTEGMRIRLKVDDVETSDTTPPSSAR